MILLRMENNTESKVKYTKRKLDPRSRIWISPHFRLLQNTSMCHWKVSIIDYIIIECETQMPRKSIGTLLHMYQCT